MNSFENAVKKESAKLSPVKKNKKVIFFAGVVPRSGAAQPARSPILHWSYKQIDAIGLPRYCDLWQGNQFNFIFETITVIDIYPFDNPIFFTILQILSINLNANKELKIWYLSKKVI